MSLRRAGFMGFVGVLMGAGYGGGEATAAPCGHRGVVTQVKAAAQLSSVEFCMDGPTRHCWRANLATGTYTRISTVARPRRAKDNAGNNTSNTSYKVCHPITKACRRLAKPKNYSAHLVTGDGRHVVVGYSTGWLELYRFAGMKRLLRVRWPTQSKTEPVYWSFHNAGRAMLIESTQCAGPCTESWLIDPRRLRTLTRFGGLGKGSGLTMWRTLKHVWAVRADERSLDQSDTIQFFDDRGWRRLRSVDLMRPARKAWGALAEAADASFTVTSAGGYVATLVGRTATARSHAGDILVVSHRAANVRHLRFPVCTNVPFPNAMAARPDALLANLPALSANGQVLALPSTKRRDGKLSMRVEFSDRRGQQDYAAVDTAKTPPGSAAGALTKLYKTWGMSALPASAMLRHHRGVWRGSGITMRVTQHRHARNPSLVWYRTDTQRRDGKRKVRDVHGRIKQVLMLPGRAGGLFLRVIEERFGTVTDRWVLHDLD